MRAHTHTHTHTFGDLNILISKYLVSRSQIVIVMYDDS